jgi:hypothetical protein
MCGDLGCAGVEFKLELLRQFGNKLVIRVGFRAADLVMKVRHREYDSKLLTQLQQQTEKGHGIRATGNGRSNALSRP